MDRLRNRDLRTNNNKCYAMYFDDDQNKDITNKTMPPKKPKTRSPRKKEPTKSYATDSGAESTALNKSDLAEPQTIDVGAVAGMNAIESTDVGAKPLDGSRSMHRDMAQATQCNGNDGNRNDGVEPTTNSQRLNNGTMVDGSTASKFEHRDKADGKQTIGAGQTERNDRKRRLSQPHDRTMEPHKDDDDEDDDDDDAESCETDGMSYFGKKAKIECSRTKMFQVSSKSLICCGARDFRWAFLNGASGLFLNGTSGICVVLLVD